MNSIILNTLYTFKDLVKTIKLNQGHILHKMWEERGEGGIIKVQKRSQINMINKFPTFTIDPSNGIMSL